MVSLPANLQYLTDQHSAMFLSCISETSQFVSVRNAAALICWHLLQHDHLQFVRTLVREGLHEVRFACHVYYPFCYIPAFVFSFFGIVHMQPHDSVSLPSSITCDVCVQALAKALGEVVPMINAFDEEQLKNDEDATGTLILTKSYIHAPYQRISRARSRTCRTHAFVYIRTNPCTCRHSKLTTTGTVSQNEAGKIDPGTKYKFCTRTDVLGCHGLVGCLVSLARTSQVRDFMCEQQNLSLLMDVSTQVVSETAKLGMEGICYLIAMQWQARTQLASRYSHMHCKVYLPTLA